MVSAKRVAASAFKLDRRHLLLSTTLAVVTLSSYGRAAFAQQVCTSSGGPTYLCTGASAETQAVNAENAQVTTREPLNVTTADGDAVTVRGRGALSFTDTAVGTVLSGEDDGLEVTSLGDAAGASGSVTVDTGATITSDTQGIDANGLGSGATSVTVRGDVSSTGSDAIFALSLGRDLSVTTIAGSTVSGFANGINAGNQRSGAATITVGGDVRGATGSGIDVQNYGASTTDLTVTTRAGSSITSGERQGIQALNNGSGSTVITVGGSVAGSDYGQGILVTSYGSSLSIVTGAGSSVTGGSQGIAAYNAGSGPTTITVAGDVGGGVAGIFVSDEAGYNVGEYAAAAAIAEVAGFKHEITVLSGASVRSDATPYGLGIGVASGSASIVVAGIVSGNYLAIALAPDAQDDRLELQPGYAISGLVDASAGTDAFVLGGTGVGTFNVGLVGTQFFGFETFTKEDASTWTLTGTNPGLTEAAVNGGTLLVSGSVASTVLAVADGATVGGNGTVGGLVAASGATIAPGVNGSAETLRVTGDAVFAQGSTFQVALNGGGNSSLLVDGTASIGGGTINVVATPGLLAAAQSRYTVLSASEVTGRFTDVEDDLPDVDFADVYDGTTVSLALAAQAGGTQTPKENAVAAVLGAGNAAMSFSETLARRADLTNIGASGATAPLAFDKPVEQSMALEAVHNADLVQVAPVLVGGLAVWFEGFGENTDANDRDGVRGYESKSGGVAGGIEYRTGGEGMDAVFGIGGGYSRSNVDVADGEADIDGGHVGLYASYRAGWLALNGALTYSRFDFDLRRGFTVAGLPLTAEGNADGDAVSGYAEAAYNVAPLLGMSGFDLSPALRLRGADAHRDAFDEDGAGLLNLSVDEDGASQLFGGIGIKFATTATLASGLVLRPDLALWYEHDFNGETEVGTASIGGVNFATPVFNGDQDRFAVGAGLGVDFTRNVTGHARYDGSFGGDVQSHRGSLGLTVAF